MQDYTIGIINRFVRVIFIITLITFISYCPLPGTEHSVQSCPEVSFARISDDMAKYDVIFYHINLETSATSLYLSGNTVVKIQSVIPGLQNIVLQLTSRFLVESVSINGTPASFIHQDDYIDIDLDSPVDAGTVMDIDIVYSGTPQNGAGITRSTSSTWSQTIIWTLSESFHAYNWFPVKQDLTDKADSAYIFITAPKPLTAVSNGVLHNVVDVGSDKRRFEWITRYPINYYLISMTVGDYQQYDLTANVNGTTVPQPNYIYNTAGCLELYKEAIDQTPSLIELFSDLFIPYPFADEKYGHVMAPFGGGMEHQTITMMGMFNYWLIAHELAHQWFGDYVTCATWQDIWINEGFASYSEYLAYEFSGQQSTAREWLATAYEKAMTVPGGAVYLTPDEALNESRIFSSALSYKKGAALLHMLRNEIGNDELFFGSLRQFLTEYGDSSATGLDFLDVVERHTGEDYRWFFDQWYFGKGFPTVYARYSQKPGYTKVVLTQTPSHPSASFFRMRVKVRVNYEGLSGDTIVDWTSDGQVFNIPSENRAAGILVDPANDILMSRTSAVGVFEPDDSGIKVFPVPFIDRLFVEFDNDVQTGSARLTDLEGTVVYSGKLNGLQSEIVTWQLKPGIYVLTITHDNIIRQKIVVKY